MIQIIVGQKGKGKTKLLLEQANEAISHSNGTIIYLDKSQQHIYELNSKIRLINMSDYPVLGSEGFISFICGLVAGNYDINQIFIDSFLSLTSSDIKNVEKIVNQLESISCLLKVRFIISISCKEEELTKKLRNFVSISL